MPALSLDDQEMDAVMQAAAPIDPARRGDFLEDLALELAKCPEVGPASVYRILREPPTQTLRPAAACQNQQRHWQARPLQNLTSA
jgi:hypothetical protein